MSLALALGSGRARMGRQKEEKKKPFHFRNVVQRSQLHFQAKQLSFCLTKSTELWTWAHWLPSYFWCATSCNRYHCLNNIARQMFFFLSILFLTFSYFFIYIFFSPSSLNFLPIFHLQQFLHIFWQFCKTLGVYIYSELNSYRHTHTVPVLKDSTSLSYGRLYPRSLAARGEETRLSNK